MGFAGQKSYKMWLLVALFSGFLLGSADSQKEALSQAYQKAAEQKSENREEVIKNTRKDLQSSYSKEGADRQKNLEKKFTESGDKKRNEMIDKFAVEQEALRKGKKKPEKGEEKDVNSNVAEESSQNKSKKSRSASPGTSGTGEMSSGATRGAEVIRFGGKK